MATKIEIFWNKIHYYWSYTEDITPVIKSSTGIMNSELNCSVKIVIDQTPLPRQTKKWEISNDHDLRSIADMSNNLMLSWRLYQVLDSVVSSLARICEAQGSEFKNLFVLIANILKYRPVARGIVEITSPPISSLSLSSLPLLFLPCFRLRNDLYCVEWGVKLYSLTHSLTHSLSPLLSIPSPLILPLLSGAFLFPFLLLPLSPAFSFPP